MPRVDSLHKEPETRAEELAAHLEANYGLQLDPARHKALVSELDDFGALFYAERAAVRAAVIDLAAHMNVDPVDPVAPVDPPDGIAE